MNIYVIYKFDDYDLVKETIDNIQKVIPDDSSIFMFQPNRKPKLWRFHARRKIKDCQMVILFDSLSGGKADVGKHISWELKYAEKQKKRIVILKKDPKSLDRSWYEYGYSEKDPLKPRYKTVPISGAVDFLKDECGWLIDDNLLHKDPNETLTESEIQLVLEQYRIMIDTSEKLMERRQETVNLYTTLCTTVIALIGASLAFDDFYVSAIILFASGLILSILCHNWQISLDTYDLNNTGKFAVINLLEKKLPAEIFECEYRYNKLNGIRSFSSREKVLPYIFFRLGIALMVFAGGYLVYFLLTLWGIIPTPPVVEVGIHL